MDLPTLLTATRPNVCKANRISVYDVPDLFCYLADQTHPYTYSWLVGGDTQKIVNENGRAEFGSFFPLKVKKKFRVGGLK